MLDELLARARSGEGASLALIGEPGIGKSALLAYALEQAADLRVLRACGVESEAHIPFASLFELLRPALDVLGELPAPQAAALEAALALRPARTEDRFAIGAATLSLLAAYAEARPVLLVVDNAHWLDGSSADALAFAARRLRADPVALLLAVREGEPSLADAGEIPRLRLAGLDLDASTELLRQEGRITSPEVGSHVDRLHRETGGNPLAMLELSERADWADNVSGGQPWRVVSSVAEVYADRFRSLAPEPRRLIVLLSASDSDDWATLSRAAAVAGSRLDDLADAEGAGLIRLGESGAEWRHPLARSAVYASATPAERRAAHRVLATALPDAEDDRRAWHLAYSAIGPDAAASSALEHAADRARERSAYDVASRTYERAATLALDRSRTSRLLSFAANAAWLAGLADRAVSLIDQAALLGPEPRFLASLEHLRGHIAVRRGATEDGRRILVAAADLASTVDPPSAVVMLAEAVNACFYAGDAAAMRDLADRILPAAAACQDARSEFFATMSRGMALVFSGESADGPRLIRHAVALLNASGGLRDDPRLLVWAAMGPLWLRDAAVGASLVDGALAVARERSLAGVLPFLLAHVAADRAAGDRWDEAEASFHEAIDLARESGQLTELAVALSRLAQLEARRGRADSCQRHAAEALELSIGFGLGLAEIWSLTAMGDLAAAGGDVKTAVSWYERQLGALGRLGITDVDLSPAPELVELYMRTGRADEAARLAREFSKDAATKRLPWAMARAARACGIQAGDEGFEDLFLQALALHDRTVDVFETGRSHLAYGSRLRRHRQRLQAREQLRQAIEIFDRLGAEPWSEVARGELEASGERARRRDESAINQLTPQELQIALLLANQKTTREAAAALFLSPKTIEYHLRSIYRKLDVSTRSGLSAAMASRGRPGARDRSDGRPRPVR